MLTVNNYYPANSWLYLHNHNRRKMVSTNKNFEYKISHAYEKGRRTSRNYLNLEKKIINHVQSLEEKKMTSFKSYTNNSSSCYDQSQIEFWRSHSYELSNVVLQRSVIFGRTNQTNLDSGLAINLLAA